MRRNRVSDLRNRRRTTAVRGHRWRLRPTLMALEERQLLSTIIVNNPTDTHVDGQIDLREAIRRRTRTRQADTITFDATVFATPQTITLAGTQLELSDTS